MKKYLLIVLFAVISLMVAHNANATVYFFGQLGSGGEVDDVSYGGEIGAIWPKEEPQYLLGIGLWWTEQSESESYTFLLDKVRSDEWELYGAAGINLIEGIFLAGTIGFSETCEGTVFKGDNPNDCGSYDDNDKEYKLTGSGQLRFTYKNLMIGAGYHNRRGIVGGIGFVF